MADQKHEPNKRMSAFAMLQAKKTESKQLETSLNTSKRGKAKGKKGKHADKRKLPEAPKPGISHSMAKRLRMSLRKGDSKSAQKTPSRGRHSVKEKSEGVKTPMVKSQDAASSRSSLNGVAVKTALVNEDANPAVYVQQKPPTSRSSPSTSTKSLQSNGTEREHSPIKNLEDLLNSTPYTDSTEEAEKYFEWLIHPIKPDNFFSHLFERKPLLLRRHDLSYNKGLFSSEELDTILKKNDIQFTRNIDVTSYSKGKRETHNPDGRAIAPIIWDYYENGCSIRMLNPQTYSDSVWKLNSTLQQYFGCLVGANVYLTPAGTQGFAPHYDDIEAFVIQLEGKKHWRLYKPRNDKETLPRFSSGNFDQKEIGQPILDTVLEPGDLLYFPRGVIHQANAMEDDHSLHITLSACQKTMWGDYLEKLVPQALKVAIEEDVEFRHALPRDYLNYMGIASADDSTDDRRLQFINKAGYLISKLVQHAPFDAAADMMGTQFVHDALPPVLNKEEEACSIYASPTCCKNGVVMNRTQLEGNMEIRLLRHGIVRLTSNGEQVQIYHSLENARQYHKKEPQFLEVPIEAGPAIELLIRTYPDYVTIDSLPLSGEFKDQQVEMAEKLYETGLIVTRIPIQPIECEENGK